MQPTRLTSVLSRRRLTSRAVVSPRALCLALALSMVAAPLQAQVAETFIYDVHGRLTGTTEVNSTGTSSWSGYTLDTADNITVRSAATVAFPSTPSRLLEGEYITRLQTIYSSNNNVSLAFQGDGNLVLKCGTAVKWSSGTSGTQAQFLVVQPGDGHLVLYGPNYSVIWFNGAHGFSGAFLQVQNDGNLVVYTGSTPRWATNTSCGGGGGEVTSATFTASSNWTTSYTGLTTPGGMRDGNFNSSNSVHGTDPDALAFIQADLGSSMAIDRIEIASADASTYGGWGAQYTNGAVVERSTDGVNWTSAGTVGGVVDGSYKSISMGGASTRYIRLRKTSAYLGMGDFRIYSAGGGGNQPPIAVNDTASVSAGGSVTINVLANDSDPDGNPLTVVSVTTPAKGVASITTGGAAVLYTAGVGQSGIDTFNYTISDGLGGTASALVTVTILGVGTEVIPASFSATSNYAGYTGLTTPGGMRDAVFNTSNSIHGTNSGATEIIQANLGTSQSISRIDIASASASAPGGWGALYTNGAVVDYSNDGVNWTSAGTVSGVVDGSYTSINLGGATMLYIRLIRNGYLGMGDFRVYQ